MFRSCLTVMPSAPGAFPIMRSHKPSGLEYSACSTVISE